MQKMFPDFHQAIEQNAEKVDRRYSKPQPYPSTFFLIHASNIPSIIRWPVTFENDNSSYLVQEQPFTTKCERSVGISYMPQNTNFLHSSPTPLSAPSRLKCILIIHKDVVVPHSKHPPPPSEVPTGCTGKQSPQFVRVALNTSTHFLRKLQNY